MNNTATNEEYRRATKHMQELNDDDRNLFYHQSVAENPENAKKWVEVDCHIHKDGKLVKATRMMSKAMIVFMHGKDALKLKCFGGTE